MDGYRMLGMPRDTSEQVLRLARVGRPSRESGGRRILGSVCRDRNVVHFSIAAAFGGVRLVETRHPRVRACVRPSHRLIDLQAYLTILNRPDFIKRGLILYLH